MTPSTPLPFVSTLREAVPSPARLKNTFDGLRGRGHSAAVVPLRAVAFYAAIVLPFVYLPMLAGDVDPGRLLVIVGLLLANAAALVIGHDYGAE